MMYAFHFAVEALCKGMNGQVLPSVVIYEYIVGQIGLFNLSRAST